MPKRPAKQHTVFVSHAHADNHLCDRYVAALRECGLNVWYDRTNMQDGRMLSTEIETQLKKCSALVVLLTPASVESYWVNLETSAFRNLIAKDSSRIMLPVIIEQCEVPTLMTGIKYIDAVRVGFDSAVEEIAKSPGCRPKQPLPKNGSRENGSHATSSEAEIPRDQTAQTDPYTLEAFRKARWFHDGLDFFEDRLAEAFPGLRGLRVYPGREAFERLARLLRDPLTLQSHNNNAPLWWLRGSRNMYIDCFQILDAERLQVDMSRHELLIDTVAVYRDAVRAYRSFVYVATHADQPTGIYPITSADIERQVRDYGFAHEGVAYWNGRSVSLEEYDDGYTEIDGNVVRIRGAELRTRYLTPYNFFVSSQAGSLADPALDPAIEELCMLLLTSIEEIDKVVELVGSLRMPEHARRYYYLID